MICHANEGTGCCSSFVGALCGNDSASSDSLLGSSKLLLLLESVERLIEVVGVEILFG